MASKTHSGKRKGCWIFLKVSHLSITSLGKIIEESKQEHGVVKDAAVSKDEFTSTLHIKYLAGAKGKAADKEDSSFLNSRFSMNTNHRIGMDKFKPDAISLVESKAASNANNDVMVFNPRMMSPFDHFTKSRNNESKFVGIH